MLLVYLASCLLASLAFADIIKVEVIAVDKSLKGYLKPMESIGNNNKYMTVDKIGSKFCHRQDELSDLDSCCNSRLGFTGQFLTFGATNKEQKFVFNSLDYLVSKEKLYACKNMEKNMDKNMEKNIDTKSDDKTDEVVVVKGNVPPNESCVEINLLLEIVSETVQLLAVSKTEEPYFRMALGTAAKQSEAHKNDKVFSLAVGTPPLEFAFQEDRLTYVQKEADGETHEYNVGLLDGTIAMGHNLEATEFCFNKHDMLVSDKPVYMCPGPDSQGLILAELMIYWGEKPAEDCEEINLVIENTSDNDLVW